MPADMAPSVVRALLPRQSDTSTGDKFLGLIASPFRSQFNLKAVLASLAWSLPLTVLIALAFCFLRPYNNVVYAPRAKHADNKHAPPVISKGLFDWIPALIRTKEQDLVEKVGLDAAVFMRFCRMLRNMFTLLSIIGCGILIPLNLVGSGGDEQNFLMKFTPQYLIAGSKMWAYVVLAYVFTIVVFTFLWWNYRAILRLRRAYLDSPEYQCSLHARTLMLTDVPKELRTDDGIVRVTEQIKATQEVPRAAIARNVKDLPDLVEEHDETVRRLEKHLARYLKNPDKLPAKRPTCKVNTNDKAYRKGQHVDAIEYLTARIKELEIEIKEVRDMVDKRNALSYGFASYNSISEAHGVAYAARKKGPQGTIVRLAPQPIDVVWKNLALSKRARSRNNFFNNLWVALLTLVWVGPNIMIAVFLSNLNNIGGLWPAFQKSLEANQKSWALVQGIGAPLLTSLFYLYLPAIFRRLCVKGGDLTKTSRERHVMHKLYSFFVFNNLIVFSFFSALFTFISAVVQNGNGNFYDRVRDATPFTNLVKALCQVSPYWISWLLQRNLGAAIDLSQLVTLLWRGFLRRFSSPTPREMIELTAPQPFDYAGYYNYFLFYATVAICFGPFQPIVLPVAALYFWLDGFLKKYLILYVFITKYESGGMFWRTLYNRTLFLSLLSNILIALLVVANGSTTSVNWVMLGSMGPLLLITAGFKWYCTRTFDDPIHWYQTGNVMRDTEWNAASENKKSRHDRVGVRFGHPVLYQPLITPMVSAKSQHLLKSIYSGRMSQDDNATTAGYSDVYMDAMDANRPGKSHGGSPFEFVDEHNMDFEHYKNRPEFRTQAGGDGQLFGHSQDMTRPGTPGSGLTRAGTMDSFDSSLRKDDPYQHSRDQSNDSDFTHVAAHEGGVEYPRGYHQTPSNLREHSPAGSDFSDRAGHPPTHHRRNFSELQRQESRQNLVSSAAVMGAHTPLTLDHRGSAANTPGWESGEETSYDYFRRGRNL